MKKLVHYFLSVAALLWTGTSCNSWLDDVKQTSTVSDEIIWQEESHVEQYLNHLYLVLHRYGQFGEMQFGGSLTESLTDIFKYGSVALGHKAGHPNVYVVNPGIISPDGCLYNVWSPAYDHIRRINQFLHLQKEYSRFSAEKNALWEAQARFFRAFVYFQLAERHGGVILYDDLPVENRPVSSAEDTWTFIEEDLKFAAERLPEEWGPADQGRITKGAALAFLSRAMLYAGRWQEAYDAACAVERLGIYRLMPDYAEAWKGHNAESILEFDYNRNTGPFHSFDNDYAPKCDGVDFGALGTPTQELVESYEDRDGNPVDWSPWHKGPTTETPPYDRLEPRFAATVIYSGCEWKGRKMDCAVGGKNGEFMPYREQPYSYGKTTTGYFLRKLLDEDHVDLQGVRCEQPWVVLRYAEVLLNKAEAAYRLNKIGEAQAALNEVRARVGLKGKTSSGEAWFRDYRRERKVELAFEGQLFWDMRRWKLAHLEYDGYRCHGMKITGGTYEWIDCDYEDRHFSERLYRLPIPTTELKNNPLALQYDEWN